MQQILTAIALPLHILIAASLTFYFGNRGEVVFSLPDVLPFLIPIFIAASAALFLVLRLLNRINKAHRLFSGVVIGLAISAWAQSQLLNWSFGPLDGRGIEWENWSTFAYAEIALWILIIAFTIIVFLKPFSISRPLPGLTVALAVIAMTTAFVSAPTPPEQPTASSEDVFLFHPEKNTIVILLDTFQSDYFEKIKNDFPDEVAFLSGFTFYRNTIASYPSTAPNLPSIFTGETYRNEVPFREYVKTTYTRHSLLEQFANADYESSVVSLPNIVPGASSMASHIRHGRHFKVYSAALFLDYGLFRAAPIFLKERIYNQGDWFVSLLATRDLPPDAHGLDILFLRALEERAQLADKPRSTGKFSFFHFSIPHSPWRVNETLEYDTSLSGPEGYERQARGALLLTKRIIETLQRMGIYESAEIVVMADHGTMSVPPISRLGPSSRGFHDVETKTQSSALALLLHKNPFSTFSGIQKNDAALYLKDLRCLLHAVSPTLQQECNEVRNALQGQPRQRLFLDYDWRHEDWDAQYMPPMTEYYISGHAYDPSAWRRGEFRYAKGEKERLTTFTVSFGQPVSFRAGGRSRDLVRFGWSGQETNHRWTDGRQAELVVPLKEPPKADFGLILDLSPYRNIEIESQDVTVVVNRIPIATWQVHKRGRYSATVPAELATDGRLNILLEIGSPAAPCEFEESDDCRLLGVAARELIVTREAPTQ